MSDKRWEKVISHLKSLGCEEIEQSEDNGSIFAEYQLNNTTFFIFLFQESNELVLSFHISSSPRESSIISLECEKMIRKTRLSLKMYYDHIYKTNDKGEVEDIYYGEDAEDHLSKVITLDVIDTYQDTIEQDNLLEKLEPEDMIQC